MRRILAMIPFLFLALPALGAFKSEEWRWKASIEPSRTQPGFVKIELPPGVLAESRADLDDLRVADQTDNLAPHMIRWPEEEAQGGLEWRPVRMMNEVYQPHQYARVTLDLGEPIEKNQLKVALSGDNFRRRLEIEGSLDGLTWDRVGDNQHLFAIRLPDRIYRADILRFPANTFRYLRLTVYHQPDDPERIAISGVEAALERPAGERPDVLAEGIAAPDIRFDEKKRETIVEMNLGFENRPVSAVKMAITDLYFHRPYLIEVRNAIREKIQMKTETGWDEREREAPWNPVRSGVLYRIRKEAASSEATTATAGAAPGGEIAEEAVLCEQVAAEHLNASCRYLRVRIFEQDNPPLRIDPAGIRVWLRQPCLVFDCRPPASYSLYWGNSKAARPSYDLSQSIRQVTLKALPRATLGPVVVIPHRTPLAPWSERYSVLITVVLALVAAGVGALLVKSLAAAKRGAPEKESAESRAENKKDDA